MKITIFDKPQDVLVQTVSLHSNPQNPLNTYMFFCPYCSYELDQIQGIIGRISPGLEPSDTTVVIRRCKRCEMRYVYQQRESKKDGTDIILTHFENQNNVFSCWISRTPLLRFTEHEIYLVPSNIRMSLPFEIPCRNVNCKAHYRFSDLI